MPDSAGQLFVRALGRAPGQMVASAERLLECCLALDRPVPAGPKPGGNGTGGGGGRTEERLMIAMAHQSEAEASRNKITLPSATANARAHDAAREPMALPGEEAAGNEEIRPPIGSRLVLAEA